MLKMSTEVHLGALVGCQLVATEFHLHKGQVQLRRYVSVVQWGQEIRS